MSRTPRLPWAVALSAASGLTLFLAFPPAGMWPLAFVAPAPFLWLVAQTRPRRGFLLGLVFGLGFFGATLYWVLRFGEMAWVALALLSALSLAAVGALAPIVVRPGHPLRSAFGLAALWTVADWVRGAWPLGGFTWGSVGISQVDDRALLPLAGVTGVWGVTFVVIAVAALLAETIAGGGGGRARAGRLVLALALVLAPAAIPFATPEGEEVDIAAIQIDVRVPEGTSRTEEDLEVARRHVARHEALQGDDPPDLILWGEGAMDPGGTSGATTAGAGRRAVAAVGVPTVIGAVVRDGDAVETTSTLVLDEQGRIVDRYDKVHLVPFGEYVPWRSRLGWIDAIDQIPVDRTPGETRHTIALPGLPTFGTPICFENAFPLETRAFVRAGAGFVVVPVNNASYGFTAAAEQHLQMSRMRAVETGRWFVNAGVSGISAFIEPSGRVSSRTELFRTDTLRERVRVSTAVTPYVRLGDWFPFASLVLVMGIAAVPRRRSAARPSPGPLPPAPRALVVLPTYNEAPTIEEVIDGILRTEGKIDVLVVDDSSPDGTGDIVRRMAEEDPRVRLLERPAKSGLASAYKQGFETALSEEYDLVVEMDSDLSHDPLELASLLRGAQDHDLTVGSRYVPGGSVTNWSRTRLLLSKAGNLYARFMLALPAHDATSGYRVYRRATLLELVRSPLRSDGYGFQVELVMRAHHLGFDVGEAPITFREREHGHSKISRTIVAEALWLITRWGLAMRLGRGPVR